MKIKVQGSQNFVNLVIATHTTLWPRVANLYPHLQKLEDKTLWIYETTTISDMGLSRLDRWEILINHFFTKNNPKLLNEVYGHELAHFMATHGDNNMSHSGSWITYMKAMKLPVRDNVPISPELAQWGQIAVVRCNCGAQEIHKSRLAPQMKCGRCHQPLQII
jgi:predicted SprT family Zn-dependent metalloprotease